MKYIKTEDNVTKTYEIDFDEEKLQELMVLLDEFCYIRKVFFVLPISIIYSIVMLFLKNYFIKCKFFRLFYFYIICPEIRFYYMQYS